MARTSFSNVASNSRKKISGYSSVSEGSLAGRTWNVDKGSSKKSNEFDPNNPYDYRYSASPYGGAAENEHRGKLTEEEGQRRADELVRNVVRARYGDLDDSYDVDWLKKQTGIGKIDSTNDLAQMRTWAENWGGPSGSAPKTAAPAQQESKAFDPAEFAVPREEQEAESRSEVAQGFLDRILGQKIGEQYSGDKGAVTAGIPFRPSERTYDKPSEGLQAQESQSEGSGEEPEWMKYVQQHGDPLAYRSLQSKKKDDEDEKRMAGASSFLSRLNTFG